MCKVIIYVVLTTSMRLQMYLKELTVHFKYFLRFLCEKPILMKKKSAAMPFGREALLSQFISSNTAQPF